MDTPLIPKHFHEAIGSLANLQAPDAPGLPQVTSTTETAALPLQSTTSTNVSQGRSTFTATEVIYVSSNEEEQPKDKGKKRDLNPQDSPLECTPDSEEEDEAYRSFLEQPRRVPLSTEASTSSHAPQSGRLISPFTAAMHRIIEYEEFLEATKNEDDFKVLKFEAHQSDARVEFHLKVHHDFRSISDLYKRDQQELHQQQTIMFDILSRQERLEQQMRKHEAEASRLAYYYYQTITQGHLQQAAPNFMQ